MGQSKTIREARSQKSESRRGRRPRLLLASVFCLLASLPCAPALAFDPVDDGPPRRWMKELMPEQGRELEYPEYFNDLDKAKALLSAGRYRRAVYALHAPPADADPVEVALVRGTALSTLGRTDEALAAFDAANVRADPRVQVARAQAMVAGGKMDEAIATLREHLKAHPTSIAGRYQLGAYLEQVGDLDAAVEAFAWFQAEPQDFLNKWNGQGPEAFESAADVTYIGRAIDRHSLLTGAFKNNPALHNIVLNMFVAAYDKVDRSYWPARLAAAEFCLAHDDEAGAKEEVEAALEANPNDPSALAMAGYLAVADFNVAGADVFIGKLRDVNPQSIEADLVEADAMLRAREPAHAQRLAQRVVERSPKNLEALGVLAAAAALQLDMTRCDEILAQANRLAPQSPVPLVTVADRLHDAWQFNRAEKYYLAAVERADWWPYPRHRLGALYAENGDEDKARVVLEQARAIDNFNVATGNYLTLLDEMDSFARKETEHFILVYDAERDPVLAEYLGEVMEKIYAEVCADFQHEPGRKILVEVFPDKQQFSVRTAGVPGLESYAAAMGPVIIACTPRESGETLGRYHWPRVLRHEFTHTINLSATEHRCPRWLTEGLATWQEKLPIRFQRMGPVVYERATEGTLFTVGQLNQRLTRPKGPNDGEMVYTQGAWFARYLDATHGRESIVKLLEQFNQGKTEAQAFRGALGASIPEVEQKFFAWMKEQVKDWGYDEETNKKVKELIERGEGLVKARQYEEAVDVWSELAELRPVETLPHQRLAGIYLRLSKPEKAIEHLSELHRNELKDNRYAKRIAGLYRDAGKTDEAIRFATESVYIDPYDATAHELLADLYDKTGNEEGLSRERRVLDALERLKGQQEPQGEKRAEE